MVHFISFIYLFVFCNITFDPHNHLQCFTIQNQKNRFLVLPLILLHCPKAEKIWKNIWKITGKYIAQDKECLIYLFTSF